MTLRKHPRLGDYDYRSPGAYFITICCEHRQPWLGRIDNSGQYLSRYGEISEREILSLSRRYAYVEVPKYVIMPNHLHLLVVIQDTIPIADRMSVPHLIGVLKAKNTQACKAAGYPNQTLFQTSFYDHVVRTEQDYAEIWAYIDGNPQKWLEDRFYTAEL